ncbi:hypothetical protein HAX54_018122, partial [Datura stramonium]|nr:hypothetical protein [Datura stramonium]
DSHYFQSMAKGDKGEVQEEIEETTAQWCFYKSMVTVANTFSRLSNPEIHFPSLFL